MAEAKKQSYLKGATILAATVALTKVIGMIYKVPIYNMLGDEGTAHFQVTYTIYNLLLTLSTAGVPVALSRLISAARAVGRPNQVKRYFSVGLMAFSAIGIAGMLLMFIFAPQLARFMGDPEVAGGVRALAPAVFFACLVSVYRGYSQGHNEMLPTAISQIMEVLCKTVFGLAIAWYLNKLNYGSAAVAAGAIVGVTIGLGLAVPIMAVKKRQIAKRLASSVEQDVPRTRGSTLAEIFKVSIPIMLGSSVINIVTLIDTKLVLSRLQAGAGFAYEEAKTLYGAYSKALTLFNIPSAFITPIAVSVVPVIAASIARRNTEEARGTIESSMKLTNLIAMPAAVGLCVLSMPIYTAIYPGSHEKGPMLLAILGIASFFVCSYVITNAVLQASGHEKMALLSLPIGGAIMIIVDYALVGARSVNIVGSPIGTLVCYASITLINLIFIAIRLPERPNYIKIALRPLVCTAIMGAAAWGSYRLFHGLLFSRLGSGRMASVLCLGLAVIFAVIVYFASVISLRAVTREDAMLLPKGEKIAKILKLR